MRHFKGKIKEDDKYRTSARHRPWATDYAPVRLEELEKFLDKAIFENHFAMKREAEEKARRKEEKVCSQNQSIDPIFMPFLDAF